MAEYYENASVQERVILVGVITDDDQDEKLSELAELVRTAGAEIADVFCQKRVQPHPGTYLGTGKVEELKELIWALGATGIICDDELSPAQMKNLEIALDTKVMDRTLLILDIFAMRANTSEGKIQVELAQLKYRAGRLTGFGRSMSRLGGGIGTRGPGEKKLEIDRRRIGSRISQLKQELKEVERHREVTRKQRENNHIKTVAIVGYTNAGKSTLLNRLTDAGVLEEDQLFATLDPTTRVLDLTKEQQILMTDTVGFIDKLPHHLIQAFRSTLEEAKYADYLIHVVDVSNPAYPEQMRVVYETLRSLNVQPKALITAFNKCDRVEETGVLVDSNADRILKISAKTGIGLDLVKEALLDLIREEKIFFTYTFPYEKAGEIQRIRKYGELLVEDYRPEGIYVEAFIPPFLDL